MSIMIIELNPNNIDDRKINEIVKAIKNGDMVVVPTDGVYAIVADLHQPKALEKLASFKNEKLAKLKFSILIDDFTKLADYVGPIDRATFRMLKNHLPGPFTFIIPCNDRVPKLFASKRKSVGIRMPNHPVIKQIIENLGHGLAVVSVHKLNDDIQSYYTDPEELISDFSGQIPLIVDAGWGQLEPSTVIDCINEPVILRQGLGKFNA